MIEKNINCQPFVKWVGGKRQLLAQFHELGLFPSGFNSNANTYFEPFVGGGAVFFDLCPDKAAISDLNEELITTYKAIRDDVDQLIDSLKKHENTKEYFLDMRAKDLAAMSDVEVASRFIYLNRTCFNGMYRVNRKGQFNVPFGNYKNPKMCDEGNIHAVSELLKNVDIKCCDYKEAVKTAVQGDFIYFDPPYYPLSPTSSFTSYTKDKFLKKEQIELRDTFAELSNKGCYVMLSNSDTDFIKGIYGIIKGVKVTKVMAGRAINSKGTGRGKISELVITNY